MTTRGTRFDSLTSMRALAALIVFAFHINLAPLRPFTEQGRLGVSFFFLLSGLLLGLTYRPATGALAFYRRRLARIYPAYLVALLAGFLVYAATDGPEAHVGSSLLAVLGLQSWAPDPDVYYALNPVAWSLSNELFFYLVFPLLVVPVLRLSTRGVVAVQALCLTVVIVAGVTASRFATLDNVPFWVTYILPVTRLSEFVLGITLVHLVRGRRVAVSKPAAVTLLVIAYMGAGLDPTGVGIAAITVVPLALVLVVFVQADAAGERSLLHHRWLVKAGEISYAFYLVHLLAIVLSVHAMPSPFPGARILAATVMAIAGAWALHTFVEMPLERRLSGRYRSRSPVTDMTVARS